MCIAILSTAHPDFPFILLSNRDEFINRPTLRAAWWDSPHQNVFGGRDKQRAERGTWLGITKQGRFAVLTNFRDDGVEVDSEKSRGKIVNAWLTQSTDRPETQEHFVDRLVNNLGIHDVGGFTLLFGHLRAPSTPAQTRPGLAVISNRTSSASGLTRIATTPDETHCLSNSWFGDESWPKVVQGGALLKSTIEASTARGDDQTALIEKLFDVLSVDELPRRRVGEAWETYTGHMRESIFIPAVKGQVVEESSGQDLAVADGTQQASGTAVLQVSAEAYGTRIQTVVLVRKDGMVTYVERTLYDEQGVPMSPNERDRVVNFPIETWFEDETSSLRAKL